MAGATLRLAHTFPVPVALAGLRCLFRLPSPSTMQGLLAAAAAVAVPVEELALNSVTKAAAITISVGVEAAAVAVLTPQQIVLVEHLTVGRVQCLPLVVVEQVQTAAVQGAVTVGQVADGDRRALLAAVHFKARALVAAAAVAQCLETVISLGSPLAHV